VELLSRRLLDDLIWVSAATDRLDAELGELREDRSPRFPQVSDRSSYLHPRGDVQINPGGDARCSTLSQPTVKRIASTTAATVGPILGITREDPHAIAIAPGDEPVAVVLHLERPYRGSSGTVRDAVGRQGSMKPVGCQEGERESISRGIPPGSEQGESRSPLNRHGEILGFGCPRR
jgi:hypothetical protein